MGWFWQKLLKTVFFGQNGFRLGKATQKLCVLAEKALVWQKYADQMSQNKKLVQKGQND